MRRVVALFAVVVVMLAFAARPFAWGAVGHHIVARIALARLTEHTRRAVTTILGNEDFVMVSTWADEVRPSRPETSNWHYVDIPYATPTYDAARDCAPSEKGNCVIAEIARTEAALRNSSLDARQQSEALKFLIHFVGDLHQPLHSIDDRDRGGNDVRVVGDAGRTTNLHSMWDSGIIQKRGLDENAYTRFLLDELAAHPLPASENTVDVVRWAQDAHKVGAADVYRYPEFVVNTNPASPISLDNAYIARAKDDINRQLLLAGVHLAAILNATLGSTGQMEAGSLDPAHRLHRP